MSAVPSQAEFDVPGAAVIARIRKDLLAECVEILIAEAAPLLSAIRFDDDELIVVRFRRIDIAFRTARACAAEIRNMVEGSAQ